jgi:hypothetical protein
MKIKIILSTLALAVAATAQPELQLKVHDGAGESKKNLVTIYVTHPQLI